MKKLDLEEESEPLFELDLHAFVDVSDDEAEIIEKFIEAFQKKWRMTPEIIYLSDEVEGCEGAAESGQTFLCFSERDKFTMTTRPEWAVLPVKPEESLWVERG